MVENHAVIIIGAGIAGLAAATQLKSYEYDFVILEARDRVGGRVVTNNSWVAPLDMGASWISGKDGNPITQLAKRYKAKISETDDVKSVVLFNTDGRKVATSQQNKMSHQWHSFIRFMEKGQKRDEIKSSLEKTVNRYIHKIKRKNVKGFEYEIAWNITDDWAADPGELSQKDWDQIGYLLPGVQDVFPNGYDKIAKGLADAIGIEKIRLNQVVQEVEYNANGVTVITDKQTFQGTYVICTLPLGVLQNNDVKFSPSLPKGKIKSIRRLGMGIFHKTYFIFPEVFWEEDKDWINYIPEKEGEWLTFLNFYKIAKQPILLGLNAGNYASELEKLSMDEIKYAGMRVLKKIYKEKAKDPIGIIVSGWKEDRFARGSYSYTPRGATLDDYDKLAESLDDEENHPRIFFAGEATTKMYPATVHGAYVTGIREANRVHVWSTGIYPPPGKQLNQEWEVFPEYVICKPGFVVMAKKHTLKGGRTRYYCPECVKLKEVKKYRKKGWVDRGEPSEDNLI